MNPNDVLYAKTMFERAQNHMKANNGYVLPTNDPELAKFMHEHRTVLDPKQFVPGSEQRQLKEIDTLNE